MTETATQAPQFRGTGRRKTAVAQVRLVSGSGKILVNNRAFENYFPLESLRAAAVQPENAGVLINLGSAYLNKGDFDQAVKTHLQAVKVDPKNGDAHHALAYGLYRLGKYDLAWNHVNTAKKLGVKVSEDLVNAIGSRLKESR